MALRQAARAVEYDLRIGGSRLPARWAEMAESEGRSAMAAAAEEWRAINARGLRMERGAMVQGERGRAADPAAPGGTAIRARVRVLVVFSGPAQRADGLPETLRRMGAEVTEVDTKVGGADHDLTRTEVVDALVTRVRRGEFEFVFMATPCESYSVAHVPRLRSRDEPEGVTPMPREWARYMAKHNRLAEVTAAVAKAAMQVGVAVAIENPARRGDEHSPAYWRRYRDHGSLWHMRVIAALGLQERVFAQCAFGAPWQKWTCVAHTQDVAAEMAGLDDRTCMHAGGRHIAQAHGRTEEGASRANMAAAYPAAMSRFIAEAIMRYASRQAAAQEGEKRKATVAVRGGRVADGAALSREIDAACEEARKVRPRFASMRNLRPATRAELAGEAFPGDVHRPMVPAKPRLEPKRGRKGKVHPPSVVVTAAEVDEPRPAGKVRIRQLFKAGVYDAHVVPWLQRAGEAAQALAEGRKPAEVPTVVVGQEAMATFAKGEVWDTSDPDDCRPMPTSDRYTQFPGKQQVDRAAFREAAAELQWHDDDIVQQVGEGGVEVRSACPMDTVLAWHHKGLVEHVDAAAAVVESEWREGWVSRPYEHLPTVPCRLLPRNVIMQQRTKVGAGDVIVHYEKPRISTDLADGAERSVNAGTSAAARMVSLPTAQAFGRGLAICDTAGTCEQEEGEGERPVRAVGYAVDATSAYRYLPTQWRDLWTQCFLWWETTRLPSGELKVRVGVCVDRRTGFGGAYAPNRFERVSLLAAALTQRAQMAFDDSQPWPACVARWSRERARRQDEGTLPPGRAQREPRYIQIYIDDFNGATVDDEVGTRDGIGWARASGCEWRALGSARVRAGMALMGSVRRTYGR